MKWRNSRLTTKNPDSQLGWDILAECRQLVTHTTTLILCSENSLNLPVTLTLRIHNINGQSTVPPLHSSLQDASSTRQILAFDT